MTATLAPDALSSARERARASHRAYVEHIFRQPCCTGNGRLCAVGEELLNIADDDDLAWQRAQEAKP